MGQFFDIMTIAVTIIVVFLLIITAIHSSVRLVQITIGRKSGLNKKDTDQSSVAPKNFVSENQLDTKKKSPDLDELCAIYKKKFLTRKPLSKRARVDIEQENLDLIRQLLFIIEPKASICGYINSIVKDHLEKCKPEIRKLYNEKHADNGN